MAKKRAAVESALPPDATSADGQMTIRLGVECHAMLTALWRQWTRHRSSPITLSDALRACVRITHEWEMDCPGARSTGIVGALSGEDASPDADEGTPPVPPTPVPPPAPLPPPASPNGRAVKPKRKGGAR